ncbi:ribbon-helix-helix domain-containing protein [Humibacter antri]
MRTTILLPDELYRETKRRAAGEGRTMTSFIAEALRERLGQAPSGSEPFVVDAFDGGAALPGVDLTSNAELLERMESDAPTDGAALQRDLMRRGR